MDYDGTMFSSDGPIFQRLAAQIADDIAAGVYPEEAAVPSATDLALFLQVNPATASKGVNLLVDLGVLYKKRGLGCSSPPVLDSCFANVAAKTSAPGICNRCWPRRTCSTSIPTSCIG